MAKNLRVPLQKMAARRTKRESSLTLRFLPLESEPEVPRVSNAALIAAALLFLLLLV